MSSAASPSATHATAPLDRLLAGVLAELRNGAGTGATALWAAFTPRARAPLGDVPALERALGNALLAPLVGFERAAVAPWQRRDGAARTTIEVDGAHGAARYLVSARELPDAGWCLTGLRRDDLPLA